MDSRILVCLALLIFVGAVTKADSYVALSNFETGLAWHDNQDGGAAPALSLVPDPFGTGQVMRLEYTNPPNGWGNIAQEVTMPEGAAAITFKVLVEKATPLAKMHLWLSEPDGDGWVTQVTLDGFALAEWSTGLWQSLTVPLGAFNYEPRGNGQKQQTTANKVMIGCNFGDFTALVKDIGWIVPDFGAKLEVQKAFESVEVPLALGNDQLGRYLGEGWHSPEADSTWMSGHAEVKLDSLPADGLVLLILQTNSIGVGDLAHGNELVATLGGEEVYREQVTAPGVFLIALDGALRKRHQGQPLALEAGARSPKALGLGEDDRLLGMKVTKLSFRIWPESLADRLPATNQPLALVLRDDLPNDKAAPADPELLADLARQAGFEPIFVKAGDLTNPYLLNAAKVKLLVLPYGPAFPAEGREALISYLAQGGSFVSVGGYAFDNPVVRVLDTWVGKDSLARLSGSFLLDLTSAEADERLGGAWGKRGGDGRALEGPATASLPLGGETSLKVRVTARFGVNPAGATTTLTLTTGDRELARWQGGPGVLRGEVELPAEIGAGKHELPLKLNAEGPAGVASIALVSGESDPSLIGLPGEVFDVRINTHYGNAQDALGLEATQIGAFDGGYPLSFGTKAVPADDPLAAGIAPFEGNFEGWAAAGLLGSNSAVFPVPYGRYRPLLMAQDADGRTRGSLLSLIQNHAGPFAGSNWLISGCTSEDLTAQPAVQQALVAAMKQIASPLYLARVETKYYAYNPGEEVKVIFDLANYTGGDRTATVRVEAWAQDKRLLATEPAVVKSEEGHTRSEVAFLAPEGQAGLVKLVVTLEEAGAARDRYELGYVALSDARMQEGFEVTFKDNYFRDGDRARYLWGNNQTGMVFCSAFETPLEWEKDFQLMQDLGMNVQRVLHLSPYVVSRLGQPAARPTDLNIEKLPEWLERAYKGFAQLQQQHQVAFFISMHDWMEQTLLPEELAAQRQYARVLGGLLKDVPGIIWDVQNEPHLDVLNHPQLVPQWNEFLRDKYGNQAAFEAAWGAEAEGIELGEAPIEQRSGGWSSVRSLDMDEYRAFKLTEWVRENLAGLREAGDEHPYTVGYLPNETSADRRAPTEYLDFTNTHFYGDYNSYVNLLKLLDARFVGKGFSIGEFGAKIHEAWGGTPGYDSIYGNTPLGGARWFQLVNHYALGLGASMACNWSFKDMNDCVFPWGQVHNFDYVPKATALAGRACSLLFGNLEPVYKPEALALVIPNQHRRDNSRNWVNAALGTANHALLDLHANFLVADEFRLDQLPSEVKTLIYPVPYTLSDEVFEQLVAFVEGGGTLLLTGDVTFDELRKRTRTDRLARLCGVEFLEQGSAPGEVDEGYRAKATENPLGLSSLVLAVRGQLAGATPLVMTESGPGLVENRLGAGRVIYSAAPVEVYDGDATRKLYQYVLDTAPVGDSVTTIDDAGRQLHAMRGWTTTGRFVVLFNKSRSQPNLAKLELCGRQIELEVPAFSPGLVWCSEDGKVLALEGQGSLKVDGKELASASELSMLVALDGQDLATSGAVLASVLGEGSLSFAGQKLAAERGTLEAGKWRAFQQLPEQTPISLEARESQAWDLWLLSDAAGREAGLAQLSNLLHSTSELPSR